MSYCQECRQLYAAQDPTVSVCAVCQGCKHNCLPGNYLIKINDGTTLCRQCRLFRDLEEKVRRLEERIQELENGK